MRQVLYDAEVQIELGTADGGTVRLALFTHATADVHVINVASNGTSAAFDWHPQQGDSPWPSQCKTYEPNPPMYNWTAGMKHLLC